MTTEAYLELSQRLAETRKASAALIFDLRERESAYKAALIELLATREGLKPPFRQIWMDGSVTLDGTFHGPAVKAVIEKFEAEGIIGPEKENDGDE